FRAGVDARLCSSDLFLAGAAVARRQRLDVLPPPGTLADSESGSFLSRGFLCLDSDGARAALLVLGNFVLRPASPFSFLASALSGRDARNRHAHHTRRRLAGLPGNTHTVLGRRSLVFPAAARRTADDTLLFPSRPLDAGG